MFPLTLESGHWQCTSSYPLMDNGGHNIAAAKSNTSGNRSVRLVGLLRIYRLKRPLHLWLLRLLGSNGLGFGNFCLQGFYEKICATYWDCKRLQHTRLAARD
jgi:hypothetical protein